MAAEQHTAPTLSSATPSPEVIKGVSLLLLRTLDEHSWRGKALTEALAILADVGDDLPPETIDCITHTLSKHVHAMAVAIADAHEALTNPTIAARVLAEHGV